MLTNVISPEDLSHGLIKDEVGQPISSHKPINGLIPVYKHRGETPLECINRLLIAWPILQGNPLSYAGRLDPLAEGLMLIMVGDTNKERIKYLSLDKAYEVEVLFGFSTDTGDILGLVKNKDLSFFLNTSITGGDDEKIKNVERLSEEKIKDFIGKVHFNYPIYSSKTVDGKPLFQHAREGTIHSIEIPTKEGEIYTLDILAFTMITTHDFIQSIEQDISKVTGDFRQNEIIHQWKKVLDKDSSVATNSVNKSVDSFLLMKIKCECSSGVYMRTLAEEIGKKVGVPALAYTIKRTAIDSLQLETLKGTIF